MKTDVHQSFQQMIDESLAGGLPAGKEHTLREHLEACLQCQHYLSSGNRVVAGLGGFSFEASPGLQTSVLASLRRRARQVEAAQPARVRWTRVYVAACVLTLLGSFVDWQFGRWVDAVFDMPLEHGLVAFWIVPSFCFLLLFPLLPLLAKSRASHNERAS